MFDKVTSIKTTLSLVAITVLATVWLSDAEASNKWSHSWPIDDVAYKCISVSSITSTSNVSPCIDIPTSSNVWEVSGSDLTFTETTGAYNIALYSWSSGVSGAGKTVKGINTADQITWAYIAMNKSLDWEDSVADTISDGYDWRTATGHEFGHVAGLKHHTSNAHVMYSPLPENDADRNPTTHSIGGVPSRLGTPNFAHFLGLGPGDRV